MGLTKLAIARPIVICMLFAALLVIGVKSYFGMAVDLYPKVNIPYVIVTTVYPGAGPEEIETLVSKPVEDAIGSVNGLKNIESYSQEGISAVAIEFELGTNLDTAMADVRAKVDGARMLLPQDVKNPVIQKLDIGSMPILYLGMSSKRPAREMRALADDVVKDRLGKLKGVAAVTISGGDIREIQVNVDKNRLEAYGISIGQIQQALASQNMNLPSGRIKENNREYAVRAVGEFSDADDIRNLKIKVSGNNGDRVITIADVAEVKDTTAEREETARLQGKDSVGILIQKQSDANTVEVADAVKAELTTMKDVLPPDTQIAVAVDQSTRVKEALDDVNVSLWLGALLAVLIVFLFLHNIRGTFIVAIAIPTSILATFIPIYFAGFTLNMMVMLGLSLAVGILVDDSIVVLENIYRHLSKGEQPAEAAVNGRSEIGLAAITITMVDVVVFLPIAFMGGIVGQFFKEFGITVATATLFSLFVSFTLTPMLASRWYRKGEAVESSHGLFAKFDQFYHALDRRYRRLLEWALHHRWKVVLTGVALMIIATVVVGPMLGFEFSPRTDQGQVAVTVEMPTGNSLDATDGVITQIETVLSKMPDVENIFASVGSTQENDGGGSSGSNIGQVTASLYEKESVMDRFFRAFHKGHPKRIRSDQDIAEEIRQKLARIPGGNIKVTLSGGLGQGGSPVNIELTGPDTNQLNAAAQSVKQILASTEGILNPDVSWKVGKPEIKAKIDRVKAADLGISVGEIASALRTSIAGSTDTRFRENGKEYDIRVRLKEFDRFNVSDVARTVMGNSNGRPVYLMDVAQISNDTGPTKIERKNRQRKISVTADLAKGYYIGNVQAALKDKVEKAVQGNVHINWGGEAEDMQESGKNMMFALFLSILLVYMLMSALFESMLNPLIIMFSVPMALIGALIALAISGETMSIISMIGIIMLMGLVTKNAILLVDYTNSLRQKGMERNAAILEAGPTRLRPILMTTFAMIFGMLPTALKLGRGSEMRAPMAIAVIGGLIVSTLLTLVMIPTLYTMVDDFVAWWHRLFGRKKTKTSDSEQGDNGQDQALDSKSLNDISSDTQVKVEE